MYTALGMMSMMAEDVNAPELRIYAPRKAGKKSWLMRLLTK